MDVWKDIRYLRKNPKIGHPATMLFGVVWEAAGGKPCEGYVFTAKWLAKELGRDPSSIRAQIKKLHAIHDLFHIRECNRDRGGRYKVDIYRPFAGHATAQPDPQLVLPNFSDDAIIDTGAEVTPAPRDSQGRVGQGSEAPGATGEPNCPAAFDGAAPQARRGDNPLETADPAGTLHASVIFTPGHAGNSPRFRSESRGEFPALQAASGPRGEFPALQKPPISAEKRHAGNSPSPETRGEFPALSPPNTRGIPRAQKSAEKPPDTQSTTHAPASLDSSKEESYPMVSNDLMKPMNPKTHARPPAEADEAALLAATQAHIDRCRAATDRQRTAAEPAAGKLAACIQAIADATTMQRQKERLVIRFRGLVNDPDCREWLFGFAADLKLVYGQSGREDAGLIFGRMAAYEQELADLREVQTRNGQTHWPRGKWFNKRVCDLARECGIDLPSQRKAKRLAAASTH